MHAERGVARYPPKVTSRRLLIAPEEVEWQGKKTPEGLPGKAVLFCSTSKCVHLHSLDVRRSLDVVGIWNQVWET